MEENYAELIRQKSDYKKKREEKYKQDSVNRLGTIIKKKIQTTMIGAISSIEEHFGFLWGHDQVEPLTEEQKIMKESFEKVRSEILDKGNNQARNVDVELSQYEVEWKKFTMTLPVRQGNKE